MSSLMGYPSYEEVCADIGDKVVHAMRKCVADARTELAKYREAFPVWVAEHTERGLANWIHDRMWSSLRTQLEGIPGITLVDDGTTRELVCAGLKYRFRAKRHDEAGGVQSYPTQQALQFHLQPMQLTGLEEYKLDFGYEWDPELRDIGRPVMSFRHGKQFFFHEVITGDELPGAVALGAGPQNPTRPGVTVDVHTGKKAEEQAQ
ncbi:hypothetical protein [Arthrobacter woluwensis]|uniref:hypothetical protein n=1 Tax=Arthrobacter woluwensis TaxID=156980 RepID=UPI0037FA748B